MSASIKKDRSPVKSTKPTKVAVGPGAYNAGKEFGEDVMKTFTFTPIAQKNPRKVQTKITHDKIENFDAEKAANVVRPRSPSYRFATKPYQSATSSAAKSTNITELEN